MSCFAHYGGGMVRWFQKAIPVSRRYVNLNGPQLQQLRQATSVESSAAMDGWDLTTTEGDLPENVQGVYLTPNAFVHFGVPALLARVMLLSDSPRVEGPENCAVLAS